MRERGGASELGRERASEPEKEKDQDARDRTETREKGGREWKKSGFWLVASWERGGGTSGE
jgi:hypothetical protein